MASPDEPRAAPRDPAIIFGVLVGLVTACVLGGGGATLVAKKTKAREGRGWSLVPVVVMAIDVDAGTEITMETISQRSMPEQHLTQSMVLPAEASAAVNQRAAVGLLAGEILQWTALEHTPTDECRALVNEVAGPPGARSEALTRTLQALERLAEFEP
jgi:Flp pilus assembly protein CpaB